MASSSSTSGDNSFCTPFELHCKAINSSSPNIMLLDDDGTAANFRKRRITSISHSDKPIVTAQLSGERAAAPELPPLLEPCITLRQILTADDMSLAFREFARDGAGEEMTWLQFLDDLDLSSQTGEEEELTCFIPQPPTAAAIIIARAHELFQKYFAKDASHWIELPTLVTNELVDRLFANEFRTLAYLFDDARYQVYAKLKRSSLFTKFCFTNPKAAALCADRNIILLAEWLSPETLRLALTAANGDGELDRLLRFCSELKHCQRLLSPNSGREFKLKLQRITNLYLVSPSTSQHHITLPPFYAHALAKGEHGDVLLQEARMECLQLLSLDEAVMNVARQDTMVKQQLRRDCYPF